MRLPTVVVVGLSALALLASTARLWAQEDAVASGRNLAQKAYGLYQENSQGSPSETEGVQDPTVTVEVGQANGKGTISWRPDKDCDVTKSCWALKLTAPTDSTKELTDFVTLDGLAKDLTVGFDIRRTLVSEQDLEHFFDALDDLCDALGLVTGCDNESIKERVDKLDRTGLRILAEQVSRSRRPIASFLRKATTAVFFKGRISHNEYEFFTLDSAENKSDEFGSRLEVGYSRVVGPKGRLAFSIAGQRAFKAQKTKALSCQQVDGSATLETCKELPLGAPAEVESLIGQIEYTHHIARATIRPLVSYDFEEDVLALDLPFYFLRDKDDLFAGGFRVGWRSDTDDLAASIFVSKPLDWR